MNKGIKEVVLHQSVQEEELEKYFQDVCNCLASEGLK